MHLVLYLLAALTAAAGIMLIGFGIPINEFSLGNTLIIAGTIALTAGVLAFSLAVVNRQLKRIADLLGTRPVAPARPAETADPAITSVRTGPAPRMREPAHERPASDIAAEGGFEQPRFRPASQLPANEPPPFGPDDAPRPPRAPQFPQEPPVDRRGWRPPGGRPASPATETGPDTIGAGRPAPASRAPDANFDSIWPNEPQTDAPARPSRAEGGPVARPNGGAPYPDLPPTRARSDAAPASVLKSGVVDGMAYTLYTDGSIEAELAQGVVRFGSIEELRNHLEKSS